MTQIFSTRTDKPRAYKYGEYINPLAFDPLEFAISMNGVTWDSCFDVPDLANVYCYKAPDVQPAVMTDNYRTVGLQDGSRLLSTKYAQRDMKMEFLSLDNLGESDAMLGFDALQRFLISREAFWICFANWPQRMYYVQAKMSTPTFYADKGWSCEVTLTDLVGLSRSVNTSISYEDNNGFGNNMPTKKLQYVFTSNSFSVDNLSDVTIDPWKRGHEFKVIMEGSSSGDMELTNTTTGDKIVRNGYDMVTSNGRQAKSNGSFNGTFVVNGVRPTLNDKSDGMNVNSSMMTLKSGINNFQVKNFSGKITFDFPFWWLS